MYSNASMVKGNLALSADSVLQRTPNRIFQTEILELSVSSRQVMPRQGVVSHERIQRVSSPVVRTNSALAVFVIAAIALSLLCSVFFMVGREQRVLDVALASAERQVVTVNEGASLWSLAEEFAVDGLTTAQTTELIRTWNDLDSSMLHPGDSLIVPA